MMDVHHEHSQRSSSCLALPRPWTCLASKLQQYLCVHWNSVTRKLAWTPQHMHTHFVHYKRTCVQRRPADTLHFLSNTFSPTRPSPSEGFALRSGRSLWAGRSTASGRARGACPCALTCLKLASQVHAARCIPITASAPLFLSERPRAPRPRPFHHPSLLLKNP